MAKKTTGRKKRKSSAARRPGKKSARKKVRRPARKKAKKAVSRRGRKKKASKKKAAAKRVRKIVDPRVAAALKQYEEAVRLFNRQSYRRARSLFEKVVDSGLTRGVGKTLAERAKVHMVMVDHRLEAEAQVRFKSPEEHYNYAVSQINARNLEDARKHLDKALKGNPKGDHIFYALATVSALLGEAPQAIEQLEKAIRLRPENRFQARHEPDFEILHEDLSFQQLVFPERFPAAH